MEVKAALMKTVPTFHHPEIVNMAALEAEEIKIMLENDRKLLRA